MAIAPKPFEKVTVVQIIFKLSQCNKYSISLNGIPNDAINWRETPTLCHPREPSNVESVTTNKVFLGACSHFLPSSLFNLEESHSSHFACKDLDVKCGN